MGEKQVIDPVSHEIIHRQTLGENQAILLDDERYIHYATDIEPAQGEVGYRDIWVVEINPWHHRAYGPAHEQRASQAKLPEVVSA
ncbi:2OG-Fe dioxygenase family protein [Herbaspirillum sp. NPDC087042]|uniref:2OG-Fe dioxygenase family protein n=1 Tax=Herbaspirillum sp. NPDC087042 TaxID=3364004 RepID=UPI00382C055D